jgi:hypothetical protein
MRIPLTNQTSLWPILRPWQRRCSERYEAPSVRSTRRGLPCGQLSRRRDSSTPTRCHTRK